MTIHRRTVFLARTPHQYGATDVAIIQWRAHSCVGWHDDGDRCDCNEPKPAPLPVGVMRLMVHRPSPWPTAFFESAPPIERSQHISQYRLTFETNDNGDLTVLSYWLSDPCEVRHVEGAFAAGTWETVVLQPQRG